VLSSSQLLIFHDSVDDVLLQTDREDGSLIMMLIIEMNIVDSAINTYKRVTTSMIQSSEVQIYTDEY